MIGILYELNEIVKMLFRTITCCLEMKDIVHFIPILTISASSYSAIDNLIIKLT
jgi:hypothetical protein